MDVQQLRSWIFEIYDPLTDDRTYILFEHDGATLIDLPPYSRRAQLLVQGTCTPRLLFLTDAGRAAELERWREALPGIRVAIHEADADAVPGGVDVRSKDGDRLTRETIVVHVGAHTPGASALLCLREGGVLFPGDAVLGTGADRLALPEPSYAPAEKVRAGIERLRPLEFSSVLSTHGRPVWNAGKDKYLALLDELPRPRKVFGIFVDAPWDPDYLHNRPQMASNEIVPEEETVEDVAAMGPSTLVPAWERKVSRAVRWPAAATAAAAPGAKPPTDGRRWSLANEAPTAHPPAATRRVQTMPRAVEAEGSYRRLEAAEFLGLSNVDFFWRSLDLSPAGDEVAFSWNRTGTFELFRAPLTGDAIYQLTSGTDRSVQPRYSPDGRWIAFLRDAKGDERFEIWLMDRRSYGERRLTHSGATRYSIAWSPDSRRLAYVSDEDQTFGIWAIDVADGARRQLVREVRSAGAVPITPEWSRDGRYLAYHSASESDPRDVEIWIVAGEGGEPWPLDTHPDATARSSTPSWGPRDAEIAFVTDLRGRDEVALVEVRDGRRAGPVRFLRDGHFDESGPVWQADGRAILYRRNAEGMVSVRRAYVVSRDDEPVLDAPGVHLEVRPREDGGMAYLWTGPRDPADAFFKEATEVAPRRITRSRLASISSGALVSPRHVRYPSADGAEIPALLYLPHASALVDGERPPAVVYVHGGPTAQHFAWFDPHAQWFANRGYVVLAPNVRGSTGYGRAFREANHKDWGGKDLDDVVKAADWLEREGLADGSRIAVYGGSYGGYLTLMALAKAPERWAAGCTIVGIVSLATLYRTTRGDLRSYLEAELGSPERDAALFRERSPINFVSRIAAPVLILQGRNDPRVPLSEAEQVVSALRAGGKAFAYHVYDDEGHGFQNLDNRRDALERALAFFEEHVRGRVAAAAF